MNDVVELSSDSGEDTIIVPTENYYSDHDHLDRHESDIRSLVSKFISENCPQEDTEPDFNYAEEFNSPLTKRLKKTEKISPKNSSESCEDAIETLQKLSEKYKHVAVDENRGDNSTEKTNILSNKEMKKREKEIQKQQKMEERARKKAEAEREKCLKQALAATNKNKKRTECMKFITVLIDNEINGEPYNNDIINALEEANVEFKFQQHIFPHTITWTRNQQTHFITDDGKLVQTPGGENADETLLIMKCREFIEKVDTGSLSVHIQSLQAVLVAKKITLAIYGLESYYRYQKNQKHNEMRAQVTGENERHTNQKAFFQDFPQVSRQKIEYALTELQILCSCSHHLVDSGPELSSLVVQFTKAVAAIPYKLEQYEKLQQTDWYAGGDNRDCVKVDNKGNGLNRLWNQVLTTFPLARLETAEAISSKYPTISSLMKAYEDCQTVKEAELLLQDIQIRRAAGPLSSARRIGPELSKKVYNFYTSVDGESLL